MGRSKKRCRDILPTESANHSTSVKGAIPDLQKVMVRLGWEIKKLYVGSCLNETQDVKIVIISTFIWLDSEFFILHKIAEC